MKAGQKFLGVVCALVLCISMITEGDMVCAQASTSENYGISENLEQKSVITGELVGSDVVVNSLNDSHYGVIVGDGVRLRKKPNKTATILELMYDGEEVYVYPQISAEDGNGKWTYIRRYKTNTTGWVSNDCILVG